MDFDDQLRRAVERGRLKQQRATAEAEAKALSADEQKRLHSKFRLDMSDHIEKCMGRLADYFPGFETEIIFGEVGWGAAVVRDAIHLSRGQRDTSRSRFEIVVRPYSEFNILDVAAKGTIHNKEIYQRHQFAKIGDVEQDEFIRQIDQWVVDFAELYASKT
jgi:hypothetical protein